MQILKLSSDDALWGLDRGPAAQYAESCSWGGGPGLTDPDSACPGGNPANTWPERRPAGTVGRLGYIKTAENQS